MRRALTAGAWLTAALAAGTLIGGAAGAEERFSDVPASHPQREAILAAADRGWFQGYPDGSFRPDREVPAHQLAAVVGRAFPAGASRADLASFMLAGVRTLGRAPDGAEGCEWPVFSDVGGGHPQSWDMEYAADRGWFQGYPDGSFRPDREVPAHQLAAVVGRAFPAGASRADLASFMLAGAQELARIRPAGPPEKNFFTYEFRSEPSAPNDELWLVGTDGSEPRRLTDNVNYWRWSPDGETLAFSVDEGEAIWVFDAATSQTRLLGEHANAGWRSDLWWRGDILTYEALVETGRTWRNELWIYEGTDLHPRLLTADGGYFMSSRGAGTINYSKLFRDAAGEWAASEFWSYDLYSGRQDILFRTEDLWENYIFSSGGKCMVFLARVETDPPTAGAAVSFTAAGLPSSAGFRGQSLTTFAPPLVLTELWKVDLDGGEPRRLLEDPDYFDGFQWSPDGRYLAFQVEEADEHGKRTGETGLWLLDAEGSAAPFKLADNVNDFYGFEWSPSGRTIAFREPVYDEDGFWLHAYDLWAADADRRVRRPLTAGSPDEGWAYTGFSWSDEGTLRFSAVKRNEAGETVDSRSWEEDEDGSNRRRYVPVFSTAVILEFSADGETAAYVTEVRDEEGFWLEDQLWLASADGSDRRRLADGLGNVLFLDWSPDGEMLAFWSERRDDSGRRTGVEFWFAPTDGSPPRLVGVGDSNHRVEWPRTGDWVAYGFNEKLWLAKRDGSEARLLKEDVYSDWYWN